MKLLLLLSPNHLQVQLRRGQSILQEKNFSTAEQQNFALFLQAQNHPCYLLTDLIEEDFHLETIPYLRPSSNRALLQRKFSQLYKDTPFHLATVLQRQAHGRRDVEMLLSALTNPAAVQPWLDILYAAQIPLVGIYSIAQLSASLVSAQDAADILLVSYQKWAGLRQSYFKAGHLQFSRLTALPRDASFYEHQIKELLRTAHYLRRLNHLSAGQSLTVRLLCHADDITLLQQKIPEDSEIRYEFIPLNTLARSLNCNATFKDADASELFLHLLATHPPKTHYAQPQHTHYFKLRQVQKMLNAGSALALLLCAGWALNNAWGSLHDDSATAAMHERTHKMQRQTLQILQHLPHSTMPAADVKAAVLTMRQFKQSNPLPDAVLQPLSLVLNQFPDIQLDELTWQMNTTDTPHGILLCKGHLQNFTGNYRTALQLLEQFKTTLQQQGYSLDALTSPMPDSTAASLADAGNIELFDFAVKLHWQVSK